MLLINIARSLFITKIEKKNIHKKKIIRNSNPYVIFPEKNVIFFVGEEEEEQ